MRKVISITTLICITALTLFSCSNVPEIKNDVYKTTINNASIYYRIITADPDKPHIFFLHGGPGGSTRSDEQLIPFITDNKFNWVFMDQRGSGRSSIYHKDPEKSDLLENQVTTKLMLNDIEFIRKKHELGKIVIYGHSWGGNLAAHYVDKYPGSTLGYIIASTAHHYKNNSLALRKTYLTKIPLLKDILKDILKNGYTNKHQLYKSELKRLFDGQGYSDLLFQLSLKVVQNKELNEELNHIIANLTQVEEKLLTIKMDPFNSQVIFNIIDSLTELGAYGLPITPAVNLAELPAMSDIKPNTVYELFGDRLIEDNESLYPNFKVQGVFWCGLYDIWDETTMLKASQLAPDSISFVFPRSGHDYFRSEPNLFKIKLQESIDYIMGKTFTVDEMYLEKFRGLYEHFGFGKMELFIENKQLIAKLKDIKIKFVPVADNEFKMIGGPGSGGKVNFQFSDNGNIVSLSTQGFTFKRI
jgi:pimeloyl-ACP methyl ester carboxylesterase